MDGFFTIFKKAVSELICTRLYVRPSSLSFQVTSSRSRCMVVCITNVHTYVHACERAYLVCSTYTIQRVRLCTNSYMCTTNFSSRKKAEEREHSPLSPTTAGVCVFVLTWSSKSSKSLKAHYSTSLNQQMKDELVSSTLYSTRIFERAVLMKNQTNFSRIQPQPTMYLTTTTHPNSYCGTQHRHQTYYRAIVGVGVGVIEVDRKTSSSTSFLPLHCIYLEGARRMLDSSQLFLLFLLLEK